MAENELRKHKIRAELYDNLLTEDPNDFAARVVADKPLNSIDVCNYAAQTYKLEIVTQYSSNVRMHRRGAWVTGCFLTKGGYL